MEPGTGSIKGHFPMNKFDGIVFIRSCLDVDDGAVVIGLDLGGGLLIEIMTFANANHLRGGEASNYIKSWHDGRAGLIQAKWEMA